MTNTKNITVSSVLSVLQDHIGKSRGISAAGLAWDCIEKLPTSGDERQVRKVVEELRTQGHHICAHPTTGYFMAENDAELDETCDFLYNRAMTTLTQISRMKKVSLPDLRGQLNLPT